MRYSGKGHSLGQNRLDTRVEWSTHCAVCGDPEDLASSSGSRVWGSGIPPRSCLPAAATVGFADVTSVPDAVFRLVSDVLILHRARDVDVRAKHEDIFGT